MTATSTAPAAKKTSWRPKKGLIPAFIVGLVVGPLALSYFGVTVTSRTARADLHDGILQLEASLCDTRARAEVKTPNLLESSARRDLATKHATKGADGNTNYELIGLCSSKLAG
jgi:hypothetical protein